MNALDLDTLTLTMANLNAYRQLALGRFGQLLLAQPQQAQPVDDFVDEAIRQLSELPMRLANSATYEGLYSSAFTLDQYREGALSRLEELLLSQPEPTEIDDGIDQQIRLLSALPERPASVDPYVRLFMLRTDTQPMEMLTTDFRATKQYVTAEQVLKIIGPTRLERRVRDLVPGLNATFERFEINTPLRIAHFFGQVLHESGGFRFLREIWGPTDAQRRYEPPSRLAQDLGNKQRGDGRRFLFRGVIQLTGRSNYRQFSQAVGVDFEASPELVESSPYAVLAAGWYWDSRQINAPADRDDLIRVTRLVNGGRNGLADRRFFLNQAKRVLGA